MEISQNFVAFSEYMNFKNLNFLYCIFLPLKKLDKYVEWIQNTSWEMIKLKYWGAVELWSCGTVDLELTSKQQAALMATGM